MVQWFYKCPVTDSGISVVLVSILFSLLVWPIALRSRVSLNLSSVRQQAA